MSVSKNNPNTRCMALYTQINYQPRPENTASYYIRKFAGLFIGFIMLHRFCFFGYFITFAAA